MDRAAQQGRVVFTHDRDFLVEAARRQRGGLLFPGVVYAHPLRVPIGQCVNDLELLARAAAAGELQDQLLYLPL